MKKILKLRSSGNPDVLQIVKIDFCNIHNYPVKLIDGKPTCTICPYGIAQDNSGT